MTKTLSILTSSQSWDKSANGELRHLYGSKQGATSWQTDGETMETETDFIWGGSKITADVECSHEIKTHSLEEKLGPT